MLMLALLLTTAAADALQAGLQVACLSPGSRGAVAAVRLTWALQSLVDECAANQLVRPACNPRPYLLSPCLGVLIKGLVCNL